MRQNVSNFEDSLSRAQLTSEIDCGHSHVYKLVFFYQDTPLFNTSEEFQHESILPYPAGYAG